MDWLSLYLRMFWGEASVSRRQNRVKTVAAALVSSRLHAPLLVSAISHRLLPLPSSTPSQPLWGSLSNFPEDLTLKVSPQESSTLWKSQEWEIQGRVAHWWPAPVRAGKGQKQELGGNGSLPRCWQQELLCSSFYSGNKSLLSSPVTHMNRNSQKQ